MRFILTLIAFVISLSLLSSQRARAADYYTDIMSPVDGDTITPNAQGYFDVEGRVDVSESSIRNILNTSELYLLRHLV